VLVRPDGYIAWAGRTPDGLEATLTRWGAAVPATSGARA
jgi:hypothetical protein